MLPNSVFKTYPSLVNQKVFFKVIQLETLSVVENFNQRVKICGLYYKQMTIVNDDSRVASKRGYMLIDDTRVVIYDRNMFIMQATGQTSQL